MDNTSPDFPEYDNQTTEVWDQLAEWWDDKIGDGNDYQNYLIEPATERLLSLQPGENVLDIACGAGRFTRHMAALGTTITAIDHSEKFIKRAQERTTENADKIEYLVLNAIDPSALMSLGQARFDAAVCTMGLMDMSSIEPLISTLPKLLKPGGRFVFSVMHPAFSSGNTRLVAEEFEQDRKLVTKHGVTVTDYARPYVYRGVGISGQPVQQHYFHRSISLLFNTCFKHGFVLDGLEEPTLPEELKGKSRAPLSFNNMPTIPPILVARMILK